MSFHRKNLSGRSVKGEASPVALDSMQSGLKHLRSLNKSFVFVGFIDRESAKVRFKRFF